MIQGVCTYVYMYKHVCWRLCCEFLAVPSFLLTGSKFVILPFTATSVSVVVCVCESTW